MRKTSRSSAASLAGLTLVAGVLVGVVGQGVAQAGCTEQNGNTDRNAFGPIGTQVTKVADSCFDFNVRSASSNTNPGQRYAGWYNQGGTFREGSRGFVFIRNDAQGYFVLVSSVATGTRLGISTDTTAANVRLAF